MREADDSGLSDFIVQNQRAFDLSRAHAVTRYVDDVIDAASDPPVIVRVAPAAVACKILAFIGREIGLHKAVVVAVHGARLPRPAVRDAQIARRVAAPLFTNGITFLSNHSAIRIDQLRADAKERAACAARLHSVRTGQCRYHHTAGLSLPPSIDDGEFSFADGRMIPAPCLWIDRFADCAKQPQ